MKHSLWMSLVLLTMALTACRNEDIIVPNPQEKTTVLTPDSVVIEVIQGHSHLPVGTEPELGEVYWTVRNRGFHANPPSALFPMRNNQKLVYRRQSDGSYLPDVACDTVVRIVTSPDKRGDWYALTVKMYGEGGRRLDLRYRSDSLRSSTQVFYRPKRIRPIEQTVPAALKAADTTFEADQLDGEDSDERAIKEKLLAEGFVGKQTLGYATRERWTAGADSRKVFYYWYYDRTKDDAFASDNKVLPTPVGFRGVFAGRVPFVAYDVVMDVVQLDGEKGERSSDTPAGNVGGSVLFSLRIPFRNVYEGIGWGKPVGNEQLIGIVYDAAYNYYPDAVYRVIENRAMYIPVLREFPNYDIDRLRKAYEDDAESDVESNNFWL